MGAVLLCNATIDMSGLKLTFLIWQVNEGVGFVRNLATGEKAAN